jgi:hypothetical protein
MKCRTTLLAGSFALAFLALPAFAQTESRPRTENHAAPTATPRPTQRVRIGYMTPQPNAPQAMPQYPSSGLFNNYTNQPSTNSSGYSPYGVFGNSGYGQTTVNGGQVSYGAPQVAQVTYFPTVVLTDGRIYANFGTGHGYEQVLRQCPQLTGQTSWNIIIPPCWGIDRNGRYFVMQQR